MRKADVSAQDEEAMAVVAHARWALKRGRRPSMCFDGERNPRKALELALSYLGVTMDQLWTVHLPAAPQPAAVVDPEERILRKWLHIVRPVLIRSGEMLAAPGRKIDTHVLRALWTAYEHKYPLAAELRALWTRPAPEVPMEPLWVVPRQRSHWGSGYGFAGW